jgi:site-specific DNA recombinase
MKAIIRARVSTKGQEEGHSIAAHRQRLVDYCARKGLKVIKTYERVESSTRGERKEFAAMLAKTCAEASNTNAATPSGAGRHRSAT